MSSLSDIKKLNSNQSNSSRISTLNDFILTLKGALYEGRFDKNELDTLYGLLPYGRKYLRDQSLGHTLTTYGDWSCLLSETGYSIWKYSPTSYLYNSLNELYLDDRLLENRGEATSETATSFDMVQLYEGASGAGYVDYTTESASEGGTAFNLLDTTSDYLYIGDASTFSGIKFEFQTRGSNNTLVVEYWNGSSWTTMTANANGLDDDTSDFESDGKISWTTPTDWETTAVNTLDTYYYIRISTSTTPVTVAKAYYIIPYNSVPALLALSSEQILNEDWAWCSYSTSIYVTIRNSGNTAYEGNYFITSSSSATNLQNYFIYNHSITANYSSSGYNPVFSTQANYTASGSEGIILADGSLNNVTISLPTASESEGVSIIIKAIDISNTVSVDCQSGELIDGSGSYAFSSQYEAIHIISNGSDWFIIGKV